VAEIRGVGSGVAEACGVGGGVAKICSEGVSSMGDTQPASRPKIRAAIEIVSFALFTKSIIHAQPNPCNPLSSIAVRATKRALHLLPRRRGLGCSK